MKPKNKATPEKSIISPIKKPDNIAIERFWRSVKYENIHLSEYKSIRELKKGVAEYIEFYNNRRFHQSLKYKKPMDVYMNYKVRQAA